MEEKRRETPIPHNHDHGCDRDHDTGDDDGGDDRGGVQCRFNTCVHMSKLGYTDARVYDRIQIGQSRT